LRADGSWVGHREVAKLALIHGICLRTGEACCCSAACKDTEFLVVLLTRHSRHASGVMLKSVCSSRGFIPLLLRRDGSWVAQLALVHGICLRTGEAGCCSAVYLFVE
jgi:hypothetical protein